MSRCRWTKLAFPRTLNPPPIHNQGFTPRETTRRPTGQSHPDTRGGGCRREGSPLTRSRPQSAMAARSTPGEPRFSQSDGRRSGAGLARGVSGIVRKGCRSSPTARSSPRTATAAFGHFDRAEDHAGGHRGDAERRGASSSEILIWPRGVGDCGRRGVALSGALPRFLRLLYRKALV